MKTEVSITELHIIVNMMSESELKGELTDDEINELMELTAKLEKMKAANK